jgi:DNA-binding beta-propeller fold protein YncE
LQLLNRTTGQVQALPTNLDTLATPYSLPALPRRQELTLLATYTDPSTGTSYETRLNTTVATRGIDVLAGNLSAPGAVDDIPAQARFHAPLGLGVNGEGEVFVADRENHAIRQVFPSGDTMTFAGSLGQRGSDQGTVDEARFDGPTDVVIHPSGAMFVLEPTRGRIRMIRTENGVATVSPFRSLLPSPRFLAAFPGPGDRAFVTSVPSLLDPSLMDVRAYPLDARGQMEMVVSDVPLAALAVDPDGAVLVLARTPGANRYVLRRYAQPVAGSSRWTVTGEADFGPDAAAGNDFPMPEIRAMAIDSHGYIFLTDAANGMIWSISPDLGTIVPIAGKTPPAGLAPWGFPEDQYVPTGIAVTPHDDLVVTSGDAVLQITAPRTLDGVQPPAPQPPPGGQQPGGQHPGGQPQGGAPPPPPPPPLDDLAIKLGADHPVAIPGQAVTLQWTVTGAPTQLTLVDEFAGTETPIPLGRTTFPAGPIERRQKFKLKAVGTDPATGARAEASAEFSVAVQGIDRLAGDTEHVRKAYDDGPLDVAGWRHITGLLWAKDELYFSEGRDHTIRKVQRADQFVVPFAGLRGSPQLGKTVKGGLPPRLNLPGPMAFLDSYVYVADTGSHTIQRIKAGGDGIPELFAGTPGVPGHLDGPGAKALFNSPADIVANPDTGCLLVADRGSNSIRIIAPDGTVHTINDRIHGPQGLALDPRGDRLYVTSPERAVVMEMRSRDPRDWKSPWDEAILSGASGTQGFNDGPLNQAQFNRPMGLVLDGGNVLLVADSGNHLLRRINLVTGQVDTFAGDPHLRPAGRVDGNRAVARFHAPSRMVMGDHGSLYVADQDGRALRRIGADGMVTTPGGNTAGSAAGALDGASRDARFRKPYGVAVDGDGVAFVADRDNHAIRRVTPRGDVDTFAGRFDLEGDHDARGTAALFRDPTELAMDSRRHLFVLEPAANRMREIAPDGRVTTVIAGAGTPRLIAACPMAKAPARAEVVRNPNDGTEKVILAQPGKPSQDVVENGHGS